MSQDYLQQGSDGRLYINGDLSFASVPLMIDDCRALLEERAAVDIDLRHVQRSDSAGLAFLLECQRQARQTGKAVRFFNMPAQMLSIARVSSLEDVLPLQDDVESPG